MDKGKTKPSRKIPWVEIISIIGALSWAPFIWDKLQKPKLHVKVISQYANYGNRSGIPFTMLLYKLGVMSEDQKFDVYDISADVQTDGYGWVHFVSFNPRLAVFTDLNQVPRKLNIDRSLYLNNYVVFKKDEPLVGYLLFTGPVIPDKQINQVKFTFKNFTGDSTVVNTIMASNKNQFLYDDDIWMPITDSALNAMPKDLQRMYHRDMNSQSKK